MSAPNSQPPRGWYVCGDAMHYYAGGRTACGARVTRGEPFRPQMSARDRGNGTGRERCHACERAHRALWLAGGPAL